MSRRKRAAGGAVPADPVPGDDGAALARITAFFRALRPEDWERLRLCPLQHGLEEMARLLRRDVPLPASWEG